MPMPLLPEVVASALDNTKSCLPWQRSHDRRARDTVSSCVRELTLKTYQGRATDILLRTIVA
jgi:hypothetical protein